MGNNLFYVNVKPMNEEFFFIKTVINLLTYKDFDVFNAIMRCSRKLTPICPVAEPSELLQLIFPVYFMLASSVV